MKRWIAKQLILMALRLDSSLLSATNVHGFAKTNLDQLIIDRDQRQFARTRRRLLRPLADMTKQ